MGIASLAVLLSYPVFGTALLWTGLGERILNSDTLRVQIEKPAYTIWPGRIHVKHVRIWVNGQTQFLLEGGNLTVHMKLTPMVLKRIHVIALSADGVRFQMRVQVHDTKGIERRLAAYPKLEGLPGVNTVIAQTYEKVQKRHPTWTVEVEGIHVNVTELWFFEYRYLGNGTLSGGFKVGPDVMRVGSSVQNLGPGQLRFGADQVISANFRGRVTATIPELSPSQHADQGFMDFVTAHVQLQADLENLDLLNAYLHGMDIRHGGGPLTIDVSVDKGWLAKDSTLQFETNSLRLEGRGYAIKTDYRLELGMEAHAKDGHPAVRLHGGARATYVSLAKGRRHAFTLGVFEHSQHATLKSAQVGSRLALERAKLHFPTIETRGLDEVPALLAKGNLPVYRGGSARAAVDLDLDEHYDCRGMVSAWLEDAKFWVSGIEFGSNGQLRAYVFFDPKRKVGVIQDLDLRLRNTFLHAGHEYVGSWWANLASPRIVAHPGRPASYEAGIEVVAKDAEPFLKALAAEGKLAKIIPEIVHLGNLRVTVTVDHAGGRTDVMLRSLKSNLLNVSGRVHSDGGRTLMAMVIGGKVLSVGIARLGKGTEIEPFAHAGWLNEKLREFPRPIRQVAPPKP